MDLLQWVETLGKNPEYLSVDLNKDKSEYLENLEKIVLSCREPRMKPILQAHCRQRPRVALWRQCKQQYQPSSGKSSYSHSASQPLCHPQPLPPKLLKRALLKGKAEYQRPLALNMQSKRAPPPSPYALLSQYLNLTLWLTALPSSLLPLLLLFLPFPHHFGRLSIEVMV